MYEKILLTHTSIFFYLFSIQTAGLRYLLRFHRIVLSHSTGNPANEFLSTSMRTKQRRKNYDKWFGIGASVQHMCTVVCLRVNRRKIDEMLKQMEIPFDECLVNLKNVSALSLCKVPKNCILSHTDTRENELYRWAGRIKPSDGKIWKRNVTQRITNERARENSIKTACIIKSTSMMKSTEGKIIATATNESAALPKHETKLSKKLIAKVQLSNPFNNNRQW